MSAPAHQSPHFPRLAISDLLVLAFAVGVSLAPVAPSIREVWNMPHELLRGSHLEAVAVPLVDHLAIGLKLFGVAILIRERWRSRRCPLSPGHWYFLVTGPIAFYSLLSALFPTTVRAHWPLCDNVIRAVLYLGAGIIGSKAVFRTESWSWRVALGLLTASMLIFSFTAAYRAAEICGYAGYHYRLHLIAAWASTLIASSLAAYVAAAVDLARRARRDWLHCCALLAFLLNAAVVWLAFRPIITPFWLGLYRSILP